MTTLYVSNTASNGYAAGDDSNDGLTKALPKLTVSGAESASSDDDEIIINGGTYNSNSILVDKGVTIKAEVRRAVTLTINAGQNQVFDIRGTIKSGKTFKADGLIIDAGTNANKLAVVIRSNTNPITVWFHDTELKNTNSGSSYIIKDNNLRGTFKITDSKLTGTILCGYHGSKLAQTNDKTVEVDGLELSMTGINQASEAVHIESHPTRAGALNVTVKNVSGTYEGDTQASVAVWIDGANTPLVENVNLTLVAATGQNVQGVHVVALNAGAPTVDPVIRRCTITSPSEVGDCILLGDTALANYITRGVIELCNVTGIHHESSTPHGIGVGRDVDGAIVRRNIVSNYFSAYRLSRVAFARVHGNIALNCYGSVFFTKGVTDALWEHNIAVFDSDAVEHRSEVFGVSAQAATNTAAVTYRNNLVYSNVASMIEKFVSVVASQAGTFITNAYYQIGGAANANPWSHTGTDYATLAAWQAAQEAGAVEADPLLVDVINGNYKPQDASSVGMTGTVTTEGSRPVGYDGEPFPDFDISVGAYQNRATPFHPTQL